MAVAVLTYRAQSRKTRAGRSATEQAVSCLLSGCWTNEHTTVLFWRNQRCAKTWSKPTQHESVIPFICPERLAPLHCDVDPEPAGQQWTWWCRQVHSGWWQESQCVEAGLMEPLKCLQGWAWVGPIIRTVCTIVGAFCLFSLLLVTILLSNYCLSFIILIGSYRTKTVIP